MAKAEKDKVGRETDRGMIGEGWGEVHPGRAPRLLPQVAQDKSSPPRDGGGDSGPIKLPRVALSPRGGGWGPENRTFDFLC